MKEQGVVRERDRESRQEKEKTRKRWLQARMKIEGSPPESRYLGMLPQPRVTPARVTSCHVVVPVHTTRLEF